jgi:hypothetical protein
LGADNLKKPRQEASDDKETAANVIASARKGSDSSTVFGDGRKQSSLETNSMAFHQDEEIKESYMMDSMENSRYQKIREKESPSAQTPGGCNFMIDIPTLKKLLNRPNCDFILSLIQGT